MASAAGAAAGLLSIPAAWLDFSKLWAFDVYMSSSAFISTTVIRSHLDHVRAGASFGLDGLGPQAVAALWVACALLAAVTAAFFLLTLTRTDLEAHHVLSFFITGVAAFCYFVMARGFGGVAVFDEDVAGRALAAAAASAPGPHSPFRILLWVRYVDWSVSTPLMVLNVCYLVGASAITTSLLVVIDVLMILCGALGALSFGHSKFYWFGSGAVLGTIIFHQQMTRLFKFARARGPSVERQYAVVLSVWAALWIAYPVAWIMCEGLRIVGTEGEITWYACMDVLFKGIHGVVILYGGGLVASARVAPSGSFTGQPAGLTPAPSGAGPGAGARGGAQPPTSRSLAPASSNATGLRSRKAASSRRDSGGARWGSGPESGSEDGSDSGGERWERREKPPAPKPTLLTVLREEPSRSPAARRATSSASLSPSPEPLLLLDALAGPSGERHPSSGRAERERERGGGAGPGPASPSFVAGGPFARFFGPLEGPGPASSSSGPPLGT
eukprot:tig00000246_g21512.t1